MTSIVIGAGAVGLSCAFELADRGDEVTVIDAGEVGAAASAGNAGWVTPFLSSPRAAPGAFSDAMKSFFDPEGPARMQPHITPTFITWALRFLQSSTAKRSTRANVALQKLGAQALEGFDDLHQRGVEFEEHQEGLTVVFQDRANLAKYEEVASRVTKLGYAGKTTSYYGREAKEFEPSLSPKIEGALHLESERHVRPESLTAGLATAIKHRNGTIIEHDAVTRIMRIGTQWKVTLKSGTELVADNLVIAAGFATRHLLAPLKINLPLEAAKGTSLTASGEGTPPSRPLKLFEHMVACSPFNDGVRLSGTFDVGVRNTTVDRRRLDMVIRHGLSYFDDWRPTTTHLQWAGHRPTTSDDLPVIGPVPGKEGLYVATGHGTLGVSLGPLTGRLAAEEILENKSHPILESFRITRF